VAIPASVIGAGPHHFIPFYSTVGYVCADIYQKTKHAMVEKPLPGRMGFVHLLWFWLALVVATRLGTSTTARILLTSRSQATAVVGDLEMVMRNHPGQRIEMGYGKVRTWGDPRYQLTYFRPVVVFAGNPLTIDAVALDYMQLSGLDIPSSTLEYLQACKTRIWLIPKGEPPFAVVNFFSLVDIHLVPKFPLFSDQFRQIFFQRYRKQGSSKYFDIWECPG